MKLYAAIDPGETGAAAVINERGQIVLTRTTPKGYGKEAIKGYLGICQQIAMLRPVAVGLERVNGRPTDGGSRAFKFGEGYGYWQAGLVVYRVEYETLSPLLWLGRLGIHGGDKRALVERARKEFPDAGELLRYVKNDGIAASLLIAHYLRTRSADGMREIVSQFGKDSPEAMTAILGGLNRKNRRLRLPNT